MGLHPPSDHFVQLRPNAFTEFSSVLQIETVKMLDTELPLAKNGHITRSRLPREKYVQIWKAILFNNVPQPQ